MDLAPGQAVAVVGLTSDAFADLNGSSGIIAGWDSKNSRWRVRVQGRSKALALHAQNLIPIAQEDSEVDSRPRLPPQGQPWARTASHDFDGDEQLWEAGFEPADVVAQPISSTSRAPVVIDRKAIPNAPLENAFGGDTLSTLAALGVQAYDAAVYDEGVIEQAQAQLDGPARGGAHARKAVAVAVTREGSSSARDARGAWRIPIKPGHSRPRKQPELQGERDTPTPSAVHMKSTSASSATTRPAEAREHPPSAVAVEERDAALARALSTQRSERVSVALQRSQTARTRKQLDPGEMNPYHSSDDEAEDEQLAEGISVPGRIWKRLFPHQRTCVEWLWGLHQDKVGGIVGDEMGLGKTLQIVAFFAALNSGGECGPCLVVAPATVIRQWQREFNRWAPNISPVLLLHGSEVGVDRMGNLRDVCNAPHGACSVLVTTYEMVRINAAVLLAERWQYVVLDEGHRIRNPDAEVTLICKRFNTPHRIVLTGAPIQNKLTELWSLFDFVFPGKLGTLPTFTEQFSLPISAGAYANASNFKVQAAYQCSLVLRDLIRPYLLRRLKADVELNLPNKSEQVLFCQLTSEQRTVYENFLQSDLVTKVRAQNANAFAALTTILKICNHPHLHTWDREDQPDGLHYGDWELSGKMHVLKEVLHMWHQRGDRVLIFCQTRQMLDIVEAFVRTRYSFCRLDGTTAVGARLRLIDAFNGDDSIFVFLLTTRAGGLGINLTGANRVVLMDPDWNPANDSQARERAYRVGQKRDVTIFRFVTAGTLEEKVYQRQVFKQFLSNNVLKDPKLSRRVFKPSELRDLLAPPLQADGAEGTQTGDLFARAEQLPTSTGRVAEQAASGRKQRRPLGNAGDDHTVVPDQPAATDSSRDQSGGETGFLQKLLDGAIVGSALNHELVCDGEQQPFKSTTTVEEARRLAQRAADTLRESHERRARQSIGLPTWTGRSGSAGLSMQQRFGGEIRLGQFSAKSAANATTSGQESSPTGAGTFFSEGRACKAPVGSAALLKRIEERKASESATQTIDPESESKRVIGMLCAFFRQRDGYCCTSQQLSARFKSANVDAILFRQLLRQIAKKNVAGQWVLDEAFR
ncbi:hypothetical protein AB1Y20_016816 [Prymnesium parvum]|uniref:DNA excision repair protein ERCC-6 n=1 Tax=Prymnesium parvum TaxID=97485 RepID=A0AB34IC22_PRYPA